MDGCRITIPGFRKLRVHGINQLHQFEKFELADAKLEAEEALNDAEMKILDAENKLKRLSHNYHKFLTMLTIAKCKEAAGSEGTGSFTVKEIAEKMSGTYRISPHTAARIFYTMERKGIITADDDEQYTLNKEYREGNENGLIDTLDHAGNNEVTEIEQWLSEEEKVLWHKINNAG